jgi:glutamate--cysteine ligase
MPGALQCPPAVPTDWPSRMVPHFITSLTGPLLDLERRLLEGSTSIERWFRLGWQEHTPPFYCSVDLRNAGFKLAPVDTNLYPGGFNNLSADAVPLAVQAAMSAIEKYCPDARNLVLIPENHTRNMFYFQNVLRLQSILAQTGLVVRLGSLNPEVTEPTVYTLPDGRSLTVEPLVRRGRRLGLADFDPCAILVNNDLSAGIPDILKGLDDQILLPPLHAGWAVRRKTRHFSAYSDIVAHFASDLGIDPWLVDPYFSACSALDFQAREGEEQLAQAVDETLVRIRAKYAEYRLDATPFVIVKADAGTYGMGVMSVKDASEIRNLNRRQRNKMAVVKEGLQVSEVIIQEGVPTIETVQEGTAEPVVYMMDRFVVGGFYRVHAERGIDENLNAPGAHFVPLPFAAPCNTPDPLGSPDCPPNRFYAYGVVARLALMAAALELEQTAPPAVA